MRMTAALALLATIVLAGCAAPPKDYPNQIADEVCVVGTVDEFGKYSCHSWLFGPTATQRAKYRARHGE